MSFKVGIFVACKGGKDKLVKWLPKRYETHEAADAAAEKKNKDLGVPNDGAITAGRKFALYDCVWPTADSF